MPAAPDLANDHAARRARKRAVDVDVQFATAPGVLTTREGAVRYAVGDALLTGAAGDRWPVSRAYFEAAYEPLAPLRAGADGRYRKRPVVVLAKQMSAPFAITLSDGRGTLRGGRGDWIVQYAPGDSAVVAQSIFAQTYELLD
jgi:hypothetical protein